MLLAGLSIEADTLSAQVKGTVQVPPPKTAQETTSRPRRRSAFLVAAILCLLSIAAAVLLEGSLAPGQIVALWMRQASRWTPKLAAIVIFSVTYFAVAVGRLPGFKIDRAGAAFVGASLMVAVGVLPLKDAYQAVDFDTITLLLGVMIVVANLRLSGFLRFASRAIVKRARHPVTLLVAVVALTGMLSAFLVNDTICLAMTPLVLDLVIQTKRNPIPYLLAIAMASNIGSTATITGNPQNMIIGSLSHISYGKFAGALSPVAAIGLLLTVLMISLAYPSEFWTWERLADDLPPVSASRPLMIKSVLVSLVMVAAFFAGVVPARAAIVAGGVLLLTRRIECQRIYKEIHWTLLLMFIGLFIVVAGLERSVLTRQVTGAIGRWHLDNMPMLTFVTAVLSNLVSNVPAVLVLKPFVSSLAHQQTVWLTIAMASTLAGNFTLLGSVANLIVAQSAQARGVRIGFWDYFKVGAPLTVVTIAIGIVCL
jgi:Na+/H+ antiporter NhaD/arsenite permease-like protein